MPNHEAKTHSGQEILDGLKSARESVLRQLHLLSLDARRRWQGLESRLDDVESRLDRSGEKVSETAVKTVRDLTQAVAEFLGDVSSKAELAAPARTIMHAAPRTCSTNDPVTRAAQIMWEADCGAVPVVDADGHLVGIVTDRDLCMAAYTQGGPLSAIGVGSVMSGEVCSGSPDDSVDRIARLMRERQVRRVPITQEGRLVGIVSLSDIARHVQAIEATALPACASLAQTLAAISARRTETGPGTRVAAE